MSDSPTDHHICRSVLQTIIYVTPYTCVVPYAVVPIRCCCPHTLLSPYANTTIIKNIRHIVDCQLREYYLGQIFNIWNWLQWFINSIMCYVVLLVVDNIITDVAGFVNARLVIIYWSGLLFCSTVKTAHRRRTRTNFKLADRLF